MGLQENTNPMVKVGPVKKFILLTSGLLYGSYKVFQYMNIHYPEKWHEKVWKGLAHDYFEGKHKVWTLTHLDIMHALGLWLISHNLFPKVNINDDENNLKVKHGEYTFKNPLGVAAGIEKVGNSIDGLANLGFGFWEIGDLTPEPEVWANRPKYVDCNEKLVNDSKSLIWKRVYRNDGLTNVISRICQRQENIIKGVVSADKNFLLGINIAPSKSTLDAVPYLVKVDYENAIDPVMEFSDYIVINITERDKGKRMATAMLRQKDELRKLVKKVKRRVAIDLGKIAALEYSKIEFQASDPQKAQPIVDIHNEVRKAIYRNSMLSKNTPPLLMFKIDSYWTDQEYQDIAQVMLEEGVDGAIIGSTVPINVGIKDKDKRKQTEDVALGGAGGEVTTEFAKRSLQNMYQHTEGKKLLISSGGIFTGQDVYERMSLGANLVQVYSAFAFRGPYVAKYILEEFSTILKDNQEDAQSIIGKTYRN